MKSRLLIIAILLATPFAMAQIGEFYTTLGSEMIFSFASIDDNGNAASGILRWTPVINL